MVPMVSVESVKKTYKKRKGNSVVKAVDDVSFQVHKGEILGLLGPNGAGKTTTIKMFCGLLKMDEGKITIVSRMIQTSSNQRSRLSFSALSRFIRFLIF